MSDATDVLHAIDQLRRDLSGYHGQLKAHNDLQRHCDSQRKRIGELEGLYAKAKEEIAGLRELVREMLPPLLEGDCLWCVHHWSNRGDCTGDGECELEERAKGLMI